MATSLSVTTFTNKLPSHIDAEPLPDQPEFYRLLNVAKKSTAALANPWLEVTELLAGLADNLWGIVDRLDGLTPYLPAGVLPNLVYDPAQREVDGQHRQVTVLFANFTGISDIIDAYGTADSAGIAAELNAYFCAMQEEATYYGGAVNKVDLYDQGDKLMITFGAPIAHERDAHRAALTALAMQQAMGNLSTPMAASLLSQRIGIHSGFVFAGNVGSIQNNRREYTVMGDAVNLAARLMAAAPPEQIWISQQMWRQIESGFAAQPLPPLALKGIARPISAYQLLAARDSLIRQRASRELRSGIVGREAELDTLLLHFDELLFGAGKQIVAVMGEGGVGKTRLIQEWRQKTKEVAGDDRDVRWLAGYGRSYGQRTHGIFIDLLEDLLNIHTTDSPTDSLRKLSAPLWRLFKDRGTAWQDEFSDKLAYLGHFLGLNLTLREGLVERVVQLEAESLQLQTRLALCDLLLEVAHQQPLILVLEDLHWADEASLELLNFLIDRLPDDAPTLFCLIFRLQRQQPIWQTWHDLEDNHRDFCQRLVLTELRKSDGRTLLANLMQSVSLPPEFQDIILKATDGNPLYMEEVLHTLIEDGTLLSTEDGWQCTKDIADIRVPDTLYQIIQSRIDDLDFSSPGARRLLWLAAILGTSFTEDLLRHLFLATGRDKAEFLRHLRALRNADMLQRARIEHGDGLRPGYQFRHGLVRQVAYENMLVSKRRDYHTQVANWLAETYTNNMEPHYDALAYHYDQGRQWAGAFKYHWLVGERDARAYANESANAHLRRALQIAPSAAPAPSTYNLGRVHFELGKVLVLGGEYEEALTHLQAAFADFEEDGGETAIRLCANVCYEFGRIYENRGGADNLQTALNWRDKGLALLPKLPLAETARLHALGGIVFLRQGDFDRCVAVGNESLTIAQAAQAKTEIGFAYRLLSLAARHQGRLQEAMDYSQQSLAIFEELADLIGMGREYANQGVFAFELDNWVLAQTVYHKAIDTLERVGDKYRLAMACNNLADLNAHLGDPAQGVLYAQRGLAIFVQLKSHQGVVFAHTVLASLYWRQRDLTAARSEVEYARRVVETHDIALFRPMVGRWSVQISMSAGDLISANEEIHALLVLGDEFLADEAEPIQRLWGQLLAAQGIETEAIQVLEANLTRLKAAKMRYQTGLTHLALAAAFAQIDKLAKAKTQAEQARTLFAELGARLDLQETEAFLVSLG